MQLAELVVGNNRDNGSQWPFLVLAAGALDQTSWKRAICKSLTCSYLPSGTFLIDILHTATLSLTSLLSCIHQSLLLSAEL